MENRVYDLELEPKGEGPKSCIAKFYRPGRWTKEQIQEEHTFLFDLQEHEVPVVAPLRFEDGSSIYTIEESGIFVTLFPKQGGRNPHELSIEQLRRIGTLLARLHNVGEIKQAKNRIKLNTETYGYSSLDYLLEEEHVPEELEERFEFIVEEICEFSAPLF